MTKFYTNQKEASGFGHVDQVAVINSSHMIMMSRDILFIVFPMQFWWENQDFSLCVDFG
jgi:hypothetical protein